MDKNSIIGIVIIVLILIFFSIINKPSEEELELAKRRQDSIELVQRQLAEQQILEQASSQSALEPVKSEPGIVPDKAEDLRDRLGSFASAAEGDDQFYTLENKKIRVTISSKGGRVYSVELKDYQTWDSLPLILFDGADNYLGLNFLPKTGTFLPMSFISSLFHMTQILILSFLQA